MRIAITGSTGFVGGAAVTSLRKADHHVVRLVRGATQGPDTASWDPATGAIDVAALSAVDAVVHLAGENVAGGRWTARRKAAIAESRGPATERLCRSLAALPTPPRVIVSASAVGIYGDRGDELLDEGSPAGEGFLADVATAWENATAPLEKVGARVVHLRIGVVLAPGGGALGRMLLPFRLGLGGTLGNGRQWMSWISRADLLRVVTRSLEDDALRGSVLAVGPEPVTNREFTRTLGKVLRRPTPFPVPRFALRLLFGEMADAMLLSSVRARPAKLLAAGFRFEHETVEAALRAAVKA